ncbi:MAG: IS66 family transposase [Janthinobacterium lividum]
MTRYVEGRSITVDNNLLECAMRPVALDRKNWLFAGFNAGGRRAPATCSP